MARGGELEKAMRDPEFSLLLHFEDSLHDPSRWIISEIQETMNLRKIFALLL